VNTISLTSFRFFLKEFMNQIDEMSEAEKQKLFWASFMALMAAGIAFVFRSMVPSLWADHLQLNDAEVGQLFGAGLWPIAITMIMFSLLVDKIGYKISMFCAFGLQLLSTILTLTATSFSAMWLACFVAGLGHGIIEACINPLCASIYRNEKSKWLNYLHASWPAGIMLGGIVYLLFFNSTTDWGTAKFAFLMLLIPVLAYGYLFATCHRYPVDERVENNVSVLDMLKECGGLGIGLASIFLIYEICTQLQAFPDEYRLSISAGLGIVVGVVAGFVLNSKGKWMFFILCVVMIPLAAAEIATDGWIKKLMEPSMGQYAGWALVFSASIMMVLRFFAGFPLKYMSPPGLLLFSSIFSIAGLYVLSASSGIMVFVAFVLYAIGQTFYWPTVLGLVSEQFPKGGAMTLNTVSAMGLLTVGIFGFPFLGSVNDHYNAVTIQNLEPELVKVVAEENRTFGSDHKPIYSKSRFFGVEYDTLNVNGILAQKDLSEDSKVELKNELKNTGRKTLRMAALLPVSMAVVFLCMLLYFKWKGGYKPVILAETQET
jgi:MFS family permease